jgi:hypothetical protein
MSANRLTFWTGLGPLLCYPNKRKWNPIISIQSKIEIHGDVRIAGLSRELEEANVNKEILEAEIEKAQDQLVTELCGKKIRQKQGPQLREGRNHIQNAVDDTRQHRVQAE